MKSNMKYRVGVGLTLAFLMAGGMSVDAFAQGAGGCFSSPAKMSDADVSKFTGNPGALLNDNPAGGLPMTSQVRSLVGSSGSALGALVGLSATANNDQKTAIGAGAGLAAKSCKDTSPAYYQTIAEQIAATKDPVVIAAFAAKLAEIQTAALGGGAGVGGGAGGGGAAGISGGGSTGGASGGSSGGTDSTGSSSGSFTVGSGGSFTSGGGSGTTAATPAINISLSTGTGTQTPASAQ